MVAIKCVDKSKMKGTAVDNLITEIGLLKALTHPHIVQMKDFTWDAQLVSTIHNVTIRPIDCLFFGFSVLCSLSPLTKVLFYIKWGCPLIT